MPTLALPELLTVLPWTPDDPTAGGHDPRSSYVEDYWLGVLGPSATWLIRRFAAGFDHDPDGFVVPAGEVASEIGLGRGTGASSPFTRTLHRLEVFNLARVSGETVQVRRRIPELSRRQITRLPEHLGRAHEHRRRDERTGGEAHCRRARRLAEILAETGDAAEVISGRLQMWRIDPTVAVRAAHDASRNGESTAAGSPSRPPRVDALGGPEAA